MESPIDALSSSSTTMRPPKQRAPVPLLLESFPAPPSHIPPTPTTPNSAANPPPTGPPTLPLPPVPGPSRISEHEQLLLLTANRSQRSSKYSVTSSNQRESVISVSSHGRTSIVSSSSSGGRPSPAVATSPLPPMHSPTRSSPHASSPRPSLSVLPMGSLSGRDHTQPTQQLTRISMSPMPQLSDIEDEDEHSYSQSRSRHNANESISSIDVRDIMGAGAGLDFEESEYGYEWGERRNGPGGLKDRGHGLSSSTLPAQSTRVGVSSSPTSKRPPVSALASFSYPARERERGSAVHASTPSTGSTILPYAAPYSPKHGHMRSFSGSGTYKTSSLSHSASTTYPTSTSTAYPPTSYSTSNHVKSPSPSSTSSLSGSRTSGTSFDATSSTSVDTLSEFKASPQIPGTNPSFSSLSLSSPTASPLSPSPLPSALSPSLPSPSPLSPALSSPLTPLSPTSQTIKDIRLEHRAERTKSRGLREELVGRSRSRAGSRAAEGSPLVVDEFGVLSSSTPPPMPVSPKSMPSSPRSRRPTDAQGLGVSTPHPPLPRELGDETLGGIVVTRTTTLKVEDGGAGAVKGRWEEMSVDELTKTEVKKERLYPHPRTAGAVAFPAQAPPTQPLPPTPVSATLASMQVKSQPTKTPLSPKSTPAKSALSRSSKENARAASPDLASILSATPRPVLKSKASRSQMRERERVLSQGSASGRSTKSAGAGSAGAKGIIRRRVSESIIPTPRRRPSDALSMGAAYKSNRSSRTTATTDEDELDVEADYDAEMERVLEGQGSEDEYYDAVGGQEDGGDSDSSLDLHTPLPHLMVRHGLLSPNSKLLPGAASRSGTPMDGRGSIMSMASNASLMTKSGIIKDERDTPHRRVRHRDGKLLRGGIGLTTGLGWSDSEDEDAPSPLTRRLSALNLSRRASASSIMSASGLGSGAPRRHPLARSYSHGTVLESELEHDFDPGREYDEYDDFNDGEEDHTISKSGEWAQKHRQRFGSSRKIVRKSLPPTSWQSKSAAGRSSAAGSRTSTSSAGSHLSASLSVEPLAADRDRERSRTPSRLRRPSAGSNSNARDSAGSDRHVAPSASRDDSRTSSTTSTTSIPMPATPKDLDPTTMSTPLAGSKKSMFNKEKSLPPLPSHAFPKARTFSSTASAGTPTVASTPASPAVRPLQLPRQASRTIGSVRDRPAVPVPTVLSSSTSYASLRAPSSASPRPSPTSPSNDSAAPTSPVLSSTGTTGRPKPRTGTGMVYRTTSGSKMRAPLTLASSMSASVTSIPSTRSVGRASKPVAI